ncbi:hypothetical protein HYT23_06060 [Candidatus Pacearchaeota archaeon]|nr:hypothetical protein [Candidatus Pacearchaeota archaeon]
MAHPQVEKRHGYHAIRIKYSPTSENTMDMFVCRFDDGKYHLLGYRPTNLSYILSEESEISQDLGIVYLPKGKDKLSQLAKGETFFIEPEGREKYAVFYDSSC